MKNFVLIISVPLLFGACNNKADQPATDNDTSGSVGIIYGWQSTLNDSSGRLEMKKNESDGPDSLNASSILSFLNKNYPNVILQIVKTSHDTIYVKIPQSTYLTQQMGSTGPTMYFADVVYNLTEIPGIRFVDFSFEEGDHASPATLNRESFKDE